jgi:hypothetical protein
MGKNSRYSQSIIGLLIEKSTQKRKSVLRWEQKMKRDEREYVSEKEVVPKEFTRKEAAKRVTDQRVYTNGVWTRFGEISLKKSSLKSKPQNFFLYSSRRKFLSRFAQNVKVHAKVHQ